MNANYRLPFRRLFILLLSLTLALGYANAQVTFVGSGSAVGSNSYDTTALGGFDPTGADKIVVTVHDESSSGPPSVSYAGDPMQLAATVNNGGQFVAIYYRDYDVGSPAAAGTLSAPGSNGVSIVALQGTEVGFGAFATDTGSSVDLDALYNGSAVVAGIVVNKNTAPYTGSAGGDMTTMLKDANVGSSLGVSGYAVGVSAGSLAYPFINLSATSGQVVAVAFPADGADNGTPVITSTSATDEVGNPDNSLLTQPTLKVAFDEGIFVGSGSIELRKSGGALVEDFDVITSSSISFDSTSFTITPSILQPSTSYYLEIPSGAIADGGGNTTGYTSIASFTTGPWLTGSFRVGGGGPYISTTDLGGFDPTGYDKLIITVSGEGDSVSGITMGGLLPEDPTAAFTEVATNPDLRYVTMYYIDAVDAPGGSFSDEFSITLSGSLSQYGFSLLALSGTAAGNAVASDNASATSIDFTTTSTNSIVVAGFTANGGGTPAFGVAPLTTYLSQNVGSADGAAAVATNTTAELQTFEFTGNTSTPSMIIAEFALGAGGGETAYEEWAGGTSLPFDGDGNGDGVKDGVAFLLGAGSPGDDASGLLPEPSENGDDLVLIFSMLKAADSGGATMSVEHSSDLGVTDAWAAVLVPDVTPVSQDPIVNFSIDGSGSLNVVTATIDSSAGADGKLFGRLIGSE